MAKILTKFRELYVINIEFRYFVEYFAYDLSIWGRLTSLRVYRLIASAYLLSGQEFYTFAKISIRNTLVDASGG